MVCYFIFYASFTKETFPHQVLIPETLISSLQVVLLYSKFLSFFILSFENLSKTSLPYFLYDLIRPHLTEIFFWLNSFFEKGCSESFFFLYFLKCWQWVLFDILLGESIFVLVDREIVRAGQLFAFFLRGLSMFG